MPPSIAAVGCPDAAGGQSVGSRGNYAGAVFLGTNHVDVDIHGLDAAGGPGDLAAIHHFDSAQDLRKEIIDARLWGGVHYRSSSEAGVELGRSVASTT